MDDDPDTAELAKLKSVRSLIRLEIGSVGDEFT
jgi:hypothetical protein